MSIINIKDLAIAKDLGSADMSEVRGGFCDYGCFKMPSCLPYEAKPVSHTTTVNVAQSNTQCQENPTGNGSAVFGGGIAAWNNQQAGNYVARY